MRGRKRNRPRARAIVAGDAIGSSFAEFLRERADWASGSAATSASRSRPCRRIRGDGPAKRRLRRGDRFAPRWRVDFVRGRLPKIVREEGWRACLSATRGQVRPGVHYRTRSNPLADRDMPRQQRGARQEWRSCIARLSRLDQLPVGNGSLQNSQRRRDRLQRNGRPVAVARYDLSKMPVVNRRHSPPQSCSGTNL